MVERLLSKRWLIFLITIVVHGAATRGRAIASLDTHLYASLADGFTRGDFSGSFNLAAARWTKTVYIFLLAVIRGISPEQWMHIMVGLNIVCSAALAVLIVEVARRTNRTAIAPAIALLFYLACYDVFAWMPFVLTDALFAVMAFIPFVLMARRILIPGEPPRLGLMIVALLLATFTRPPGILLIPLFAFVELVLVRRRVRPAVAAAVIALAALVGLSVRTAAVYDPGSWPFAFIKGKIIEFSAREKGGEVVYDRKETFRPPPETPGDHVIIVADRFVRFFQITSSRFSLAHNVFNLAYLLPLYALVLTGVVSSLRALDERRRAITLVALMAIGMFAFLYALTTLDFDWRSRMPVMPYFVLLAASGADVVLMRWGGKRTMVVNAA